MMKKELAFFDDDELIFKEESQRKKGYMKLYHYITENLITQRLSGCEYAVVLLLLRMTQGYRGQKETALSLKFIKARTGYNINRINQAILRLIKRRMITRTREATRGQAARYSFNDNIDQWVPTP